MLAREIVMRSMLLLWDELDESSQRNDECRTASDREGEWWLPGRLENPSPVSVRTRAE